MQSLSRELSRRTRTRDRKHLGGVVSELESPSDSYHELIAINREGEGDPARDHANVRRETKGDLGSVSDATLSRCDDRVTRGSWSRLVRGGCARRGPIYRRLDKNANNDGAARSASFGLRKRLRERTKTKTPRDRRGGGREEGGEGEEGGRRKWNAGKGEGESGGGSEERPDDRTRRMRKRERNCRSNVTSVRGVCLERRRLHQPSDRESNALF